MKPFGPLDYVLDLGDRASCSSIENATPGTECKVLVYPESDPTAERIQATGTLSPNGELFIVKVSTLDGKQDSYPVQYRELKRTVSICKSD
jgi:hypothetical protein